MDEDISNPIRADYDRIADEYARRVFPELANKPFDREILDRFASLITGRGTVCDMGCGPGHIARYLHDAGANVCGLDLSAQMVEQARRLSPHIAFRKGNMMALPLESDSLAGITAFYAIVNIPKQSLPKVFREMTRVLQPDGLLLLTFHISGEKLEVRELFGKPISMGFFYFDSDAICADLERAGLSIEEVVTRGPYAPEIEVQTQRAFVLARKRVAQFRRSG